MDFIIERDDGKIARVELPDDDDMDFWDSVEKHWPQAYDHIDEDMIIPGYMHPTNFDETFYLGEDQSLCVWILGGPFMVEDEEYGGDVFQTYYETREEAVREAERKWSHLTPREQSKRRIVACTYHFEDGGALPSDLLWESDSTEVHRKIWPVFFSDGELEAWGEGQDMCHPVGQGTLYALPFEIEYEFEDGEDIPHEADDQFWLAHVVSIRWLRE